MSDFDFVRGALNVLVVREDWDDVYAALDRIEQDLDYHREQHEHFRTAYEDAGAEVERLREALRQIAERPDGIGPSSKAIAATALSSLTEEEG